MKRKLLFYTLLAAFSFPAAMQAQMVQGRVSRFEKAPKAKPVYEWNTFITGAVSYAASPLWAAGLRVGMVKKAGFYVAAKSNFSFDSPDYTHYSYPVLWSGENFYKRLSFTGGGVLRISQPLMLYAGAGYGVKYLYAENLAGKVFEIDGRTGFDVETGLMYSIGKFVLSAGINTIDFVYMEGNVGIGIIF